MIRMVFRLVMLVVMLSGWALASLSLHVIRTPGKIIVIPKERLSFDDTYVDARNWTMTDMANHPELVRRLLDTDKVGAFKYMTGNGDPADEFRGALVAPAKGAPSRVSVGTGLDLPVEF